MQATVQDRLPGDRVSATGAGGTIPVDGSYEGVVSMTAIVHHTDKLRELDDGTRQAWHAYNEGLRGLGGEEYERAETDSWEELQRELRRLERRRKTLTQNST
jgi:hypothetical protein